MSNQLPNSTGQSKNNKLNQDQTQANTTTSRTAANTPNNNNNNNSNTTNTGLVNKHLAAVTGSHPTTNKSNIHLKKNDQTQSDSSNSFNRQNQLVLSH